MGIGIDEGGAYEGMVGMRDSWDARVCLMALMLQICFTDYWLLIQKIIDNIELETASNIPHYIQKFKRKAARKHKNSYKGAKKTGQNIN